VRDLRALPKTDLHVHLEGSIRPATLVELAERAGRPVPSALGADLAWRFVDFPHFIEQYLEVVACLQRPEDFARIAYELCADQASQGVRWSEVTFTICSHATRLGDWDGPVEAVREGFARGAADFGTECRLVLDCVWATPREWSEQTLAAAVRHRPAVVALGIGGPETLDTAAAYADLFESARAAGLRAVPHAGEIGPAAHVAAAIDLLHADRVGHGIRCLDDPALVERLRELRVPLEVCPSSNVATGAVATLASHPLPALLAAGLVVTLNSDDPGMFASPLLGEYELARHVFGLSDDALADLAAAGVRASFAPDDRKAPLLAEIDAWRALPA
jgi:adenosine deaminase